MRTVVPVVLAAMLALAGCSAPTAQSTPHDDRQFPADPPADRLGWEQGVWYNESIAVNQSDGLDAAEREAFVARTMARIERIRGLEFRESVPVEVISRAEYRNRSVFGGDRPPGYHAWHNQVWEAALIVGETENASREFEALYDGSVQGYYSPARDRIVVVSDAPDPRIDRAALAHELVHALQDQRFGFVGSHSRDVALAHDGLTEGDARYVETLYLERCAAGSDAGGGDAAGVGDGDAIDGESGTDEGDPADGSGTGGEAPSAASSTAVAGDDGWECVPTPSRSGGGGGSQVNAGLFAYVYQPYADGPAFVHRLRERGGWAAVNAAYDDRPVSTEQTVHPERYPEETPVSVTVSDRSGGEWSRFDLDRPTERLGETGLFAMFWYNDYAGESYPLDDLPYSTYNYTAAPADGWAGDRLVPYRRGDDTADDIAGDDTAGDVAGDDTTYGYVWAIEFDTSAEAGAFQRAYRAMLQLRFGARRVDARDGVYRVSDGPFADAFRIERDGRRVVITNAPTVAGLDGVRTPSVSGDRETVAAWSNPATVGPNHPSRPGHG